MASSLVMGKIGTLIKAEEHQSNHRIIEPQNHFVGIRNRPGSQKFGSVEHSSSNDGVSVVSAWKGFLERRVMSTNKNIGPRDFEDTVTALFPTTYEPGTPIDKAVTKGRQEGRQDGKLVGQIKLLQNLLGQPETPDDLLFGKDRPELEVMVDSLKAQYSHWVSSRRERL